MAFRIRWTHSAANDFEDIAQKIERDADLTESSKITRRIHYSITGLKEYPYIGEALDNHPGFRRRLVDGFGIVYRVFEEEQAVEIVRLLHQRQDIKKHLR